MKELIENIKAQIKYCEEHPAVSDSVDLTVPEAKLILQALTEQPQWIPISSYDELPDGNIWITRKSIDIAIQSDGAHIKSVRDRQYVFEGEFGVIAYLPYVEPEPYQPKTENP